MDDLCDDGGEARYMEARKQVQQEFKNLESTKEYGEKHYMKNTLLSDHTNTVAINGFWVDVAKHSIEHGILNKPFMS